MLRIKDHYFIQQVPFIDAIAYTIFVLAGVFLYALLGIIYFYFGKMFSRFYGVYDLLFTENIYTVSIYIAEGAIFVVETVYALYMIVTISVEFPKSDMQLLMKYYVGKALKNLP